MAKNATKLMDKLRRFARLRGMELPYRRYHEVGRRAEGFASAIHQVAIGPRADSTILVTDLGGMMEDPNRKLSELTRARRGGRQVVALAPVAAIAGLDTTSGKHQTRWMVEDVLGREQALQLARATQLLRSNGVPLIPVRREESPAHVMSKIARARATLRRGRL